MYSTRKTAGLCLLVLFLCAAPLFSEEPSASEEFFFFEEFFLFGELFPSEDSFISEEDLSSDEETFISEEPLPDDEEYFFAEESFPDDEESFISEESLSGDDESSLAEESLPDDEESLLVEEPSPGDEEPLLAEEPSPGEEALLSEESPPSDEDLLLSEEGFFFEAPPLIFEVPPFVYEPRSFNDIFPNFSRGQRMMAFSDEGLKHYFEKDGSPALMPVSDSGIDLLSSVMAKKPSHIIEAMVLVPYNKRELDMLDIYNALGNIANIKDYSFNINGRDYNIFEETTRLENARSRKSIVDPPPADTLPYAETMYLRFKDAYYGNLFIRGDISMSLYGITYSLTNFTDVRYFLVPIIKAERLSVIIYLEPVKEGVLVYSMSGLYLPGFIADRVNITPSINRRINALISWITEGLRRQENEASGTAPTPAPLR